MALCALNMLLAQGLGLHFHRHMQGGPAEHATSLHVRDAGLHLHEHAGSHHAASDHASHPDLDLEVDPLGKGFAKYAKVWLGATLQIVGVPALLEFAPAVLCRVLQPARPHPELFVLRPPSNAPPLKPSAA